MTAAKRAPLENKPSLLLTKEENDQLFRQIGPRCLSLATAIVQVCFSEPPYHRQWIKNSCGAACFIKDNVKRSYFIRVYCLNRQVLLWEQEIYINFKFKVAIPQFLTFEGDNCQIGLNFADIKEASIFSSALGEKLRQKAERKAEKKRLQSHQQGNAMKKPGQVANGSSIQAPPSVPQPAPIQVSDKKMKKEKKKLTKHDIGLPTNFQHVSHVGWDPNTGFAIENVDPNLQSFFLRAGVSEKDLNNPETRAFIYDFIDKHGGMEAAIREATLAQAPPVPARNPPTPQIARTVPPAPSTVHVAPSIPAPSSAPPPPPSRVPAHSPGSAPRLPQGRPAPPNRPPPQMRPHQPSQQFPAPLLPPQNVPPPPPQQNIPPPPPQHNTPPPPPPPPIAVSCPPPPPQSGPPPPPPPPLPPADFSQTDTRSTLMDAIKTGTKLKSVDVEAVPKSGGDSRNELLDQIRDGIKLKPVEVKESAPANDSLEGMAGALARALQERSRVIHSDSEEEEVEDDEDDWED